MFPIMRKTLTMFAAVCMTASFAPQICAEEEIESRVILSAAANDEIVLQERAAEEEVTALLPQELKVTYTDGTEGAEAVRWETAGDVGSGAILYQFVPVFESGVSVTGNIYDYAVTVVMPAAEGIQSVTGFSNETTIYEFLKNDLGLNTAVACGILSNLYHESNFDPTCLNENDTGGTQSYGIAQWNNGTNNDGGRYGNLISWCTANGYDYTTLTGQLAFMKYELQTYPYYGYMNLRTGYTNTANGAYTSAWYFAAVYEGCATQYYEARRVDARDWFFPYYGSDVTRVTGVSVAPSTLTIGTGESYALRAVVSPSDATDAGVVWVSDDTSVATVSSGGVVTGVGIGTAVITAHTIDAEFSDTCTVTVLQQADTEIAYRTYVQSNGWTGWAGDGEYCGTKGQSKRMEAIQIRFTEQAYSGSIQYKTYIQKSGWESSWTSAGNTSGTIGLDYRLEAIQIKLTGTLAQKYDIYYRTYAQKFGWLGWAKNGASSGTAGFGYRLEGIQIMVVPKDSWWSYSDSLSAYYKTTDFHVNYRTYVHGSGWQNYVKDGAYSGTKGQSLMVEGITVTADGNSLGSITYRSYVQGSGWESSWKSAGTDSGAAGRSLRVEAIQIKLTGTMANIYDVYYRAYVEKLGWLDFAYNGASAGTVGYDYRIEGIQIILTAKGRGAPGSTTTPYLTK